MDKDQILQMSRHENEGQPDEWEQSIDERAAVIGKTVGLIACVLVVLLAEYALHNRDLGRGAWVVYFAMEGSSDLYKYLKTKKRAKLIWASLELFCAVTYLILMILYEVLYG